MTSRERMAAAMRPGAAVPADRVPVMCQLALGHYFLHAGDPIEIWNDTDAFAEALVQMQRRYRFDGILVNLPGRDPRWRRHVSHLETLADGECEIAWRNGRRTVAPRDDNPRVIPAGQGRSIKVPFDSVDPDRLFYVEPHDLGGVTYPTRWCLDAELAEPGDGFFPPWHWDSLRRVRAAAPDVSVHGEVFSPFSQLMELVDHAEVLMALMRAPAKIAACLARLVDGAVRLACGHFEAGADAVLISSAFAGAGFLSPNHYREFVLPFERELICRVRERHPGRPIYTHTCGAIGDRLELMLETGTNGIDTLDPPPLGTVDLADAKRRLAGRAFIKGNVDPVNTVLLGTPGQCLEAAREKLRIAKSGGGYILSTACSVPPHAPPENVLALAEAAERWGAPDGLASSD